MAKSPKKSRQSGGAIAKSILYNRGVLYFIFILSLGYLFYMLTMNDFYTFTIFVIVGFLTTFFSKNMVVILSLAMSVSFVFKYGTKLRPEGFQEGTDPVPPSTTEAVPPTAATDAVPPAAVPPPATVATIPPTATAGAVPPPATVATVPPTATAGAVPPLAKANTQALNDILAKLNSGTLPTQNTN